ncbi:MAG: hypothetical protein WAQ27_06100 [Candidatus Microsaccharimonas sp.]
MKTLLVIFGITGDLSSRKLLPALSNIITEDPSQELSIVGVSRREVNVEQLVLDATGNQALAERTSLYTMDLAQVGEYQGLKQALKEHNADQTLMYLAVPPGAAAQIVDLLGEAGINSPDVRLLFEKPFGYDLASAQDFLGRTAEYFTEDQIYRIDHYAAKEIAIELLELRQNAENHHHHWGAQSVKAITVVATEAIGIEGRAQFYEQTGALRDFVQGHLMQLLSLVLIQNPQVQDVPAQRLKALSLLGEVNPHKAARAQYEGYQAEANNPGSQTETFVAFELFSADPAWKDVPIRLVTGKALSEKRSYVSVEYTDGTSDIFDESHLTARDGHHLDAYERVLIEAIADRKEIFTSSPEVIRSWEILAPLQTNWSMDDKPLPIYKPGLDVTTLPFF